MKSRILLPLVPLLGLTLACGNVNRVPRYKAPEPYAIQAFKRQTKNQSQDFLFNWKREAYSKVSNPITKGLSEDMKDVLARHGQPDYLRKGWRSLSTNEFVDEWAFWDRGIIVQFVQGELVFEGPLTDMDRWRIEHGYPRRSSTQTVEGGVQRDIWDYQGVIDSRGRIVTFTDEKLVSVQLY